MSETKWIELRPNGHLVGRYDPIRRLLEIKDRGYWVVVDLSQYDPQPPKLDTEPTDAVKSS